MPVLFRISSASMHYKPTVGAVESKTGVGVLVERTGGVVQPDLYAVRCALPAQWQKAFDRTAFHFDRDGRLGEERFTGLVPFMTLRNLKGVFITTLYATPYHFDMETADVEG